MVWCQARSQDFSWGGGGEYPKNPDQIINIGTISHASAEDTWLLWRSGGGLPRKNGKFEILRLLGNALKSSIIPSPTYFLFITRQTFLASWGGGGGEGVDTPRFSPLPTGLGI